MKKILVLLIIFWAGTAQALPDVPVGDDAYNSLYRLSSLGLVSDIFLTQRPLSRTDFAHAVSSARENLDSLAPSERQAAERELARLAGEFGPQSGLRYRVADPFMLSLTYGGIGKRSFPVENSNGQVIDRKAAFGWKQTAWLAFDDRLAVYGELRQAKRNGEQSIRAENAYLALNIWNVGMEAGKLSQWWGGAMHGNLLLTNNAPAFSAIRLYNRRPLRLPAGIGGLKINTFLADLDEHRDYPGVNLLGLRLAVRFADRLEAGISRVTMFGGRGTEKYSPADYLRMYFSDPNRGGKFEVNELASIDFLLNGRLSGFSFDLYGELGGEDEAGFRPSKLGYVAGIYMPYIPSGLDLRIEYADTHVENFPSIWYRHRIYTTGYRYKGNIIGHHMGTDARNLYIAAGSLNDLAGRVRLALDLEKRGLSDEIIETGTGYIISIRKDIRHMVLNIDYEYNITENQGGHENGKIKNHLVSTGLSFIY